MPKRRKSNSATRGNLKNLEAMSPCGTIAFLGLVAGGIVFIVGFALVIVFADALHNIFGFSNDLTFLISAFVFLFLLAFTMALIIGLSVYLIKRYQKQIEIKYRGLKLANIDAMSGVEFEQYLKRVLTFKGYSVGTTRVTGDLGVDLVASANGIKIAIQAKRYNGKVSRNAISDAVAGMYHYGANRSMVITNSYFSPGAITLASSTRCALVDRDTLAVWINEYQGANSRDPKIEHP